MGSLIGDPCLGTLKTLHTPNVEVNEKSIQQKATVTLEPSKERGKKQKLFLRIGTTSQVIT